MWVGRVSCRRGQEEVSAAGCGLPALPCPQLPLPPQGQTPQIRTECQPGLRALPEGRVASSTSLPVFPQKQCLQHGMPGETRVGRWIGR